MKIAPETKIWVVTNPTKVSMIEDVLYPTNFDRFQYLIAGMSMGNATIKNVNLTIYTDEGPARMDAEARLAARV